MEIGSTLYYVLFLGFIVISFIAVIWAIVKQFQSQKKLQEKLLAYAATHGGEYKPQGEKIYQKGFSIPHDLFAEDVVIVQSAYGQDKFFTQSLNAGENNTIRRTLFVYSLPLVVRHIYLDSKIATDSQVERPQSSRAYSPEGVFGKYYDVYFLEGDSGHALSIFSPTTMEKILTSKANYDMEFFGKEVTFLYYGYLNLEDRIASYEAGRKLVDAIIADQNNAVKLSVVSQDQPGLSHRQDILKPSWWSQSKISGYIVAAIAVLVTVSLIVTSVSGDGRYAYWAIFGLAGVVPWLTQIIFLFAVIAVARRWWLKRQMQQDLAKYRAE